MKFNSIALVHRGIEDIAKDEIKEIINKNAKPENEILKFSADFEELCKLNYESRSLSKVAVLLEKISFSKEKDLLEKIQKVSIEPENFVNSIDKIEVYNLSQADSDMISRIKSEVNKKILDLRKKDDENKEQEKLEIKQRLTLVITKIKLYVCLDTSGKPLDERDFIIHNNPPNLHGSISYALVKLSSYSKGKVFVDALCQGGKNVIEAAHHAQKIPVGMFRKKFSFMNFKQFNDNIQQKLEKLNQVNKKKEEIEIYGVDSYIGNIKNARENLRVAKCKDIKLFQRSIDWLDTLFDANSVDILIAYLPRGSRKTLPADTANMYREFFSQASYVLNEKGRIGIISSREDLVKNYMKNFEF
ncbi:MAG: hypothetical protein AABX59_03680, partial [Nanoarchaeota archaeon]